ncbi:MAG: hypothetical protein H7Y11_13230 [Armatimonadetes bacterium]|nr:hypothetical protein [Anaerolineae bacterium]
MATKSKWNVTEEIDLADLTQVFSGGACNLLDATGTLLRNRERDRINNWLTERSIRFFDPQIHPETHGVDYDYHEHHPLELAARAAAKVNLYEVSPRSFGGITSFEIAADHFRRHEPMVIYYSDGDPDQDTLPAHTPRGHPLFVPHGIRMYEAARQAHYKEMIKNANNIRKYLMQFAFELTTLTVTFDNVTHPNDIAISPTRMHAADLFRAVVKAASGDRIIVTFTGGKDARDERGNPIFLTPNDPSEVEIKALLDQYLDEGNELRRAIAQLIDINVFTRVVYTQRSAIIAMEELLRVKGMLS